MAEGISLLFRIKAPRITKVMSSKKVILKVLPVFAGIIVFSAVCLSAQERTARVYELYNSTSTPENYKRILKFSIDRLERTKKTRAEDMRAKKPYPVFKFGKVYAVPNPAVGVKHPVIHIEAGLADKIEVKIYAPDGSLREEAVITDSPKIIKGVYAFEYRFVSNDTPYGTSTFMVRAFKTGFAPLETSGKMIFVNTGQDARW